MKTKQMAEPSTDCGEAGHDEGRCGNASCLAPEPSTAQRLERAFDTPERAVLQAAGNHPAPCARHCEARAFEIEIRRLTAERDAALSASRYETDLCGQALADLKTITAERDALKADAARYRHVRGNPAMLLHLSNLEFDAAIDAAMVVQS